MSLRQVGDLSEDVQISLRHYLDSVAEGASAARRGEALVRLVAATDIDPAAAAGRGDFRNGSPPPAQRDAHPGACAARASRRHCRPRRAVSRGAATATGVRACGFSPDAMRAILQYGWPGNARELANRVRQAAVMCERTTLKAARATAERNSIIASLRWSEGNVTRAAQILGVSRTHLHVLCEKHGLDPRQY